MPEFDPDEKPSRQENEYFARQDIDNLRSLSKKQAASLAVNEREALRKLHHMKCPRCGFDLHVVQHGDTDTEACFNCHGVWLDAGALEQILSQHGTVQSHSVVEAVLNLFRKS